MGYIHVVINHGDICNFHSNTVTIKWQIAITQNICCYHTIFDEYCIIIFIKYLHGILAVLNEFNFSPMEFFCLVGKPTIKFIIYFFAFDHVFYCFILHFLFLITQVDCARFNKGTPHSEYQRKKIHMGIRIDQHITSQASYHFHCTGNYIGDRYIKFPRTAPGGEMIAALL